MSKDAKTAKTIQFDREDLVSLAENISYECYKLMEAVRLEDLRVASLGHEECIKKLKDDHEEKIKEEDEWWTEKCDGLKERIAELHEDANVKRVAEVEAENKKVMRSCDADLNEMNTILNKERRRLSEIEKRAKRGGEEFRSKKDAKYIAKLEKQNTLHLSRIENLEKKLHHYKKEES